MRYHVLSIAGVLSALLPVAAHATVVTSSFTGSYSVTGTGVSPQGSTPASRYTFLGGNATSAGTPAGSLYPSFAVFQVNGSAVLSALQAASGITGGNVTSINGLTLNLSDMTTIGGNPAEVAGSLVFSYATNATALSVQATSPTFDSTQTGGLSTQLGALDPLGTGTFTPGALNAYNDYLLSGATGLGDILNAIDSGSTFYIAVSAGTSTTEAAFGGYYGLTRFLNPSNLTVDANVSPVPEPASLGLVAASGAFLLGRRRRNSPMV